MDDLRFLFVGRALQSIKAERIVVGRNARDRQLVDGRTGSSVPAGSIVIRKQFLVGDRPARVNQPRPWNEINRIEPHAKAAPKIGSSTELAGHRDAHVVVDLRAETMTASESSWM